MLSGLNTTGHEIGGIARHRRAGQHRHRAASAQPARLASGERPDSFLAAGVIAGGRRRRLRSIILPSAEDVPAQAARSHPHVAIH